MLAALASLFRYDPDRPALTGTWGNDTGEELQYTPVCEIILSEAVRELLPVRELPPITST